MLGVVDEEAGGLVWVAFALCDESLLKGEYHEEDANLDDNGRGGE